MEISFLCSNSSTDPLVSGFKGGDPLSIVIDIGLAGFGLDRLGWLGTRFGWTPLISNMKDYDISIGTFW